MYHKAQHIDTGVYQLRDMAKAGITKNYKVTSAEQVADTLMKATASPVFEKHRNTMMGEHATPTSKDRAIVTTTADTDDNEEVNWQWWMM
jgi:hypothetical protein